MTDEKDRPPQTKRSLGSPSDCQLVIMAPQGLGRVDINRVTGFVSCHGIGYGPWTGRFSVDIGGEAEERLLQFIRSNPYVTMYQYVTNSDNTLSTYQYDAVSLMLTCFPVNGVQEVSFRANARRRI